MCGHRPERVAEHRDKRMIGGENVKVSVWPWQVSVQYQPNSSAPFIQVCGGAIIHRYWIMTAASYDVGVLQEAEVDLMSRSLCNKPEYWNYTVAADMLCVSQFGGGVDGCETNLGGPLNCYIEIEERYFLIGIRVKATSCGQPYRPNVYLKVYSHYYWIERELNNSLH
ncbi:plasminogen [Garra rufa]|uniref:plasminogen n=1 Tax=Garra rufa TaxID=137080 RepID=UPI003CCEAA85